MATPLPVRISLFHRRPVPHPADLARKSRTWSSSWPLSPKQLRQIQDRQRHPSASKITAAIATPTQTSPSAKPLPTDSEYFSPYNNHRTDKRNPKNPIARVSMKRTNLPDQIKTMDPERDKLQRVVDWGAKKMKLNMKFTKKNKNKRTSSSNSEHSFCVCAVSVTCVFGTLLYSTTTLYNPSLHYNIPVFCAELTTAAAASFASRTVGPPAI